MNTVRTAARLCLDMLYPRQCIITGARLKTRSAYLHVSQAAANALPSIGAPYCHRCSLPFAGEVAPGHICHTCTERQITFNAGCSIWLHEGGARQLVHWLKFKRGRYLATDLAKLALASPHLQNFLYFNKHSNINEQLPEKTDTAQLQTDAQPTILVPVPLHKKRLRARGYNQSALFASALVKELKTLTKLKEAEAKANEPIYLPTPPFNNMEKFEKIENVLNISTLPLLHRIQHTSPQAGLNLQERLGRFNKLKKSIQVCPKMAEKHPIKPRTRYILVDDVHTTSTTLNACAYILQQAGAKHVDVLTLTRQP